MVVDPDIKNSNTNDTELTSLLSDTHGKQRRQERQIQKIELQRARRYGMEEPAKKGRLKYTYGGVVFIYDPRKRQEVTCFPSRDEAALTSGTKVAEPVLLAKKQEHTSESAISIHVELRRIIIADKVRWRSHSVLVVDMSGSMRRDDVNGARCRSDGVWMALARDFVRKQLESKSASTSDLVSVIAMKEESDIVMLCEPIDWVLYNTMIEKREWSELRPSGGGNYLPALDLAENLLNLNKLGSCSLSLMFFSDGKPSDKGDFAQRMGAIASKFGRRLTVCCIGMADKGEDFSTLEKMVKEAKDFGSIASFNKPSLSTDSLSNIITSLVTSLTSTKTEMTDLLTGKAKSVRTDIRREKSNSPDDLMLTADWTIYESTSKNNFVERIWSWSLRKNHFVYIMDPRCVTCFQVVGNHSSQASFGKGILCPSCKACYFCKSCVSGRERHVACGECKKCLKDRREKQMIMKSLPSFSVAIKSSAFGEGAERLVRKFRFLGEDGMFVGPKMVAKESRFVELKGDYADRMGYHTQFLRTQALAQKFADRFNASLDDLTNHFGRQDHHILRKLPRVQFLEPLVVELREEGQETNVLIEPMLEGKYVKFNNNMGYVIAEKANCGLLNSFHDRANHSTATDFSQRRHAFQHERKLDGLGAIEEGSEDEEEDDEDEADGIIDTEGSRPLGGDYRDFSDYSFAQAFSHFTYARSKEQFLVVDLQGVLQVNPDGTRCFMLTDPAIHHRKKSRHVKFNHMDLGRTDRGEKGIKAFFQSHTCNDACRMLGLTKHMT